MKVTFGKIDEARRPTGKSETSVKTRRVRDAAGKTTSVNVIDTQSRTFDRDFLWVFGRNVAKARHDNKRVTGKPDADVGKR